MDSADLLLQFILDYSLLHTWHGPMHEQLLSLCSFMAALERPLVLYFLWQLGLSKSFESYVISPASPSLSQFLILKPL